jgi:hypothetical protein
MELIPILRFAVYRKLKPFLAIRRGENVRWMPRVDDRLFRRLTYPEMAELYGREMEPDYANERN